MVGFVVVSVQKSVGSTDAPTGRPPMLSGMTTTVDTQALDQLVGSVFGDFAAAMTLPLVRFGDRFGMYVALRDSGPSTPAELAARCALPAPIVHQWLANQAASGYITVDAEGTTFSLTPEQTAVFADEGSGVCMLAGFQLAAAYTRSEPTLAASLRNGHAYPWGDHDPELFEAVERFYRPAYEGPLVTEWITALDGVGDTLRAGAQVADVGCGHGLSTVVMAQAFPASRFLGIDDHAASIERARRLATERGVTDRVRFEVRSALDLDGSYDLIAVLDAFHDMGHPERVAAYLAGCLAETGACLVVEPFAADRLTANLTPLGRAYYAASTLGCTPSALSQSDDRPLGAQAGPTRLKAALEAGFGRVRVATTTPFNLVLEARR